MSRLIDADMTRNWITEDWFLDVLLSCVSKSVMKDCLLNVIDSIPLAYDVDNVVEQLEELKQYRKLGTVEKLQTMMDNGAFTGTELAQIAAMQMKLKEYQQLGTVEELREARTKQTQKVIKGINMMTKESAYYCKCCGQKLDWRDMKGKK